MRRHIMRPMSDEDMLRCLNPCSCEMMALVDYTCAITRFVSF